MEELVQGPGSPNARAVFERWMSWDPSDTSWLSYIKFELRAGEVARARAVYERYVECHCTAVAFMRFAKFELRQRNFKRARAVFETMMDELEEVRLPRFSVVCCV